MSYLICGGGKDVENRSKPTTFRGTVYIQSSGRGSFYLPDMELFPSLNPKTKSHHEYIDGLNDLFKLNREHYGLDTLDKEEDWKVAVNSGKPFFISGAIVGKVDIVNCVQDSKSPWAIEGMFHWILANPVLFEKPIINVEGRLGFFNVNI
jgi:hypothetical protein